MTYRLDAADIADLDRSMRLEWMLADGVGGYAMGTVADIPTRRYHGLLVAAIDGTLDRRVVVPAVLASIDLNAANYPLSSNQFPGTIHPDGFQRIVEFECQTSAVKWTYEVEGVRVTKELSFLAPGCLQTLWTNGSNRPVRLILRPMVAGRSYHGNMVESPGIPEKLQYLADSTAIIAAGCPIELLHPQAHRTPVEGWYYRFEHQREAERGLDPRDDYFIPCELAYVLMPGESAQFIVKTLAVQAPSKGSRDKLDDVWAQAADRFVVQTPKGPTIVAGYPWFTDWGRDTMIALPGLCLCTGRIEHARGILRRFASRLDEGMIPNRIVEGGRAEFNSIDSTLWFVDASWQTLQAEWDEEFAVETFTAIESIHAWHVRGTRFGIRIDPKDGLPSQGRHLEQLTWMDAKIGDWVVTPRRGKPIEVSALWIHAMRCAVQIAERLGKSSEKFRLAAERAEDKFERRYWRSNLGYYLDTADPDDASLRPNQVLSMGLEFAPHAPEHARIALRAVTEKLWTPVGLRTLSPDDAEYKGRFEGPLPVLDSRYHQGTVWPWLIGAYVRAQLRFGEGIELAQAAIDRLDEMLVEYGVWGIAEVYDGDAPHRPNGCPWQAWSVAEAITARRAVQEAANASK